MSNGAEQRSSVEIISKSMLATDLIELVKKVELDRPNLLAFLGNIKAARLLRSEEVVGEF